MGMYLIEAGVKCSLEDTETKKRSFFTTRKTCVFMKEEVQWTSSWRVCFQHFKDFGNPRYKLIVPKKDVTYG